MSVVLCILTKGKSFPVKYNGNVMMVGYAKSYCNYSDYERSPSTRRTANMRIGQAEKAFNPIPQLISYSEPQEGRVVYINKYGHVSFLDSDTDHLERAGKLRKVDGMFHVVPMEPSDFS